MVKQIWKIWKICFLETRYFFWVNIKNWAKAQRKYFLAAVSKRLVFTWGERCWTITETCLIRNHDAHDAHRLVAFTPPPSHGCPSPQRSKTLITRTINAIKIPRVLGNWRVLQWPGVSVSICQIPVGSCGRDQMVLWRFVTKISRYPRWNNNSVHKSRTSYENVVLHLSYRVQRFWRLGRQEDSQTWCAWNWTSCNKPLHTNERWWRGRRPDILSIVLCAGIINISLKHVYHSIQP